MRALASFRTSQFLLLSLAMASCGLDRASAQQPNNQNANDQRAQQELERFKQVVTQRLGNKEDGFFVIALSQQQYIPANASGTRFVGKNTVEVQKAEGRAAAVDVIVAHMTKKIETVGRLPAPKRDWMAVGRYANAEQAEQATQQAITRFNQQAQQQQQQQPNRVPSNNPYGRRPY